MRLKELIKQKPNEKLLSVIRRHPLTFVSTVFMYLLLAVIPMAFYFFIQNAAPNVLTDPNARALLTLGWAVYELSIALFFYASFLVYYLDMLIITNERMVEVSQENLFSRKVSELELFKIQDATSNVQGFVATIFKYGTLDVQTAGEQKHFIFEDIPRVHDVRRTLMHLADEDRGRLRGGVGGVGGRNA